MAITDVREYAHLSPDDIDEFAAQLDAIRAEIEGSLGADDARYIHRVIDLQRRLAVGARVTLMASVFPPAWVLGTAMLSLSKILENMEIGHNVLHGQWDWMNDPEIHSGTWEWDINCPAEAWKHFHNFVHHTYTNVLGMDNDIGYKILRVRPEQRWTPGVLGQPVYNALLALLFEWGVALHDIDFQGLPTRRSEPAEVWRQVKAVARKVARQAGKDYVLFPLLSGPNFVPTLCANAVANVIRNVWAHTIIFCGHFPDGAQVFTAEHVATETKAEWYLRQLLGSANFEGNRALHVLSGSLGYQIEHHLFPDLPSNRYPAIATRVRDLCRRLGLPYTTGSLPRQYWQTVRTITRLSGPGWPKAHAR